MNINVAQLDWLTLTTFAGGAAGEFERVAYQYAGPHAEEQKRLQYKGIGGNGVFAGAAMQNGRPHAMFQASGSVAHLAASGLVSLPDVACTRIDLQVTVPLPKGYDARRVYDDLIAWETDGKRRLPALVQSGDGLDTIYIGNRKSDRYARLYVKPVTDGRVIRFETEFKGDHAKHIWHRLRQYRRWPDAQPEIDALVAAEVQGLPELKYGLSKRFLDCVGVNGQKSKPQRATKLTGGLRWLSDQVQPAIFRLMNDHEIGYTVRNIVRSWAAEADAIAPDETKG